MASASPPGQLLSEIVALQAQRQPEATALWWQGEARSYAQLQRGIDRLAERLAAIGAQGDRVAVLAWNCPAFVELAYAVPAAGRILVPLNARLAAAELCYQLRQCGARLLFGDPALLAAVCAHADWPSDIDVVALDPELDSQLNAAPNVEPTVAPNVELAAWLATGPVCVQRPTVQPADPAWLLFTSGSTGRPKGAVLTHASLTAGLRSAALARPVLPGDRYYYPFPLFHVSAHNVLLQHRYGGAVVLARSFDAADTIAACRALGITSMSLAPTMLALLLDHPDYRATDLESVRSIGYGAAAMPATLLRRLLADTEVGLCQSYGMTELSGSVSFLTADDHRRAAANRPELLASVGRPLPTAEVRLVDDAGHPVPIGHTGEIAVRAAQCMAGYWRDAEATAQALVDGWLRTGDIGRFDDDGYLYVVDRKKDMIISGGENIASREVEEVLRAHPAVRDCAVIGLPDARWGEQLCAVVVLAADVDDAVLAQHCRRQLAGYKTPRRWLRVSALPQNAAGKVDKPALRRQFAAVS